MSDVCGSCLWVDHLVHTPLTHLSHRGSRALSSTRQSGAEGVRLAEVQRALSTPFVAGPSRGTQRAKALGWGIFLKVVFQSPTVHVPTVGADKQPRGDVEGLVRLA